MAPNNNILPEDFLTGPGPKVEVNKIDFTKTELPEYADHWAVIIDNVMTAEECDLLLKAAENYGGGEWERAMVNIGGGEQMMITDTRNCGRIIWDSPKVVEKIWARCEKHVPEIQALEAWPRVTGRGPTSRKEIWEVTRPNERMRFLKYVGGEYFRRKSLICLGNFSGFPTNCLQLTAMACTRHQAAESARTLHYISTSTTRPPIPMIH